MRSVPMLWGMVLGCAVSTGCTKPVPPPSTSPIPPGQVTMGFCGYSLEFWKQAHESSGAEGHRNCTRNTDGTEKDLDEDITIKCGPQTARIVNGKLTAAGKDRGTVKPGDTIRVTSTGKLSVNGAAR